MKQGDLNGKKGGFDASQAFARFDAKRQGGEAALSPAGLDRLSEEASARLVAALSAGAEPTPAMRELMSLPDLPKG